jgi:hypothetical protein
MTLIDADFGFFQKGVPSALSAVSAFYSLSEFAN